MPKSTQTRKDKSDGKYTKPCTYSRANSCVQTGRTQKVAQILLYGYCVVTPISYFYKMAQRKIMHDKPACVQTWPTVSQSSCLGWTSLPLSHAHPTMFYIRLAYNI